MATSDLSQADAAAHPGFLLTHLGSQKTSLPPNCNWRIVPALVIFPKFGSIIVASGAPRLTQFNELKESKWNSKRSLSKMLKFLKTEMFAFL